MYSVNVIADYVIKYCNDKRYSLSNLKLQKILYFIQAEFLVSKNEPCFSEEIEAWDFGPVVPEVYHRYKMYGSSDIPYINIGMAGRIKPNDKTIIDGMIDSCSRYSAAQLVDITHRQTPWMSVYAPYQSNIISKASIKRFFMEE